MMDRMVDDIGPNFGYPDNGREVSTKRSTSPYRRPISRSRSRSRSRGRYASPERRRRFSRSPSPRRFRRSSPPRRPPPRREIMRGSEDERKTTCSIFVGNIPYSFEERDMVNLFERFGRLVTISVPMDRFTRRNRGFAFVEFEQRTDADDAFNKYNDYELEGRKLRLDWDIGRPAKDRIRVVDRSPRRERQYRHSPPRERMRSPPRFDRGDSRGDNNRSYQGRPDEYR